MSPRPPSSTHRDESSDAYASTPEEGRGMAHKLLPLTSPVTIMLQASQGDRHPAYRPMPPLQPTYIPRSPHLRLNHQPIPPRNSSPTSPYVSLRDPDWNPQPELPTVASCDHSTYFESSSPTLHNPPITSSQASTMAPDVFRSRAPIPSCLEPCPRDRCTKFDPFAPSTRGAYSIRSSPAAFASHRDPVPPNPDYSLGYTSHRMPQIASGIPSRMDLDRYSLQALECLRSR